MFARFTQRFTKPARAVVQQAVVRADDEAGGKGDGQVQASDLLVVMLDDAACLASRVLVRQGVDLAELRAEVLRRRESHVAGLGEEDAAALATIGIDLDEVLRHLDRPRPRPVGRRRRGPRVARTAKQALEHSLREAIALRHNYIGTEHLLLGLARAEDPVVTESLHACGTSYEALRDGVRDALRRAG